MRIVERGIFGLGQALVMMSAACAVAPVESENVLLPRRQKSPTKEVELSASSKELSSTSILGRVVDSADLPLPNREIVLADRQGKRIEVTSDARGEFRATGVTVPYDLLLRLPHGEGILPLAFFGLRTERPQLRVDTNEGAPRVSSQSLRVGVSLPACPAGAGPCWVTLVSVSPSGSGLTSAAYAEGTSPAAFDVEHVFAALPRPDESLNVHVLAGDALSTQYAYAYQGNVQASPGERTSLAMTRLSAIPPGGYVTVEARGASASEAWQWMLSTELQLGEGVTIPMRFEMSSRLTMRLPTFAGASWRVAAWAEGESAAPVAPSLRAWSGTLGLSATSVLLEVPPPALTAPTLATVDSSNDVLISWTGGSGLAVAEFADAQFANSQFRAFTTESEIRLSRLEALGIPRPQSGDYLLELRTLPSATLDDGLSETRNLGHENLDVPGGSTRQRLSVRIAP